MPPVSVIWQAHPAAGSASWRHRRAWCRARVPLIQCISSASSCGLSRAGWSCPCTTIRRLFGHVLAGDEPRFAATVLATADAQSLALADGVERQAHVLPHHLAFRRHHLARLGRQVAVEELAERALADEADAGAVLFGVVRQAVLFARWRALAISAVCRAGTSHFDSCCWFSRCRK